MTSRQTYLVILPASALIIFMFQNCANKWQVLGTTEAAPASKIIDVSLGNSGGTSGGNANGAGVINSPSTNPSTATGRPLNSGANKTPQIKTTCQFSIAACLHQGLKTTFYRTYSPTSDGMMTLPAGMTDNFYLFDSNSVPQVFYQCDANAKLIITNMNTQPTAVEQPFDNACPVRPAMVAAAQAYLDQTPIGTATPWSEGTLYRNSKGAFFVDKKGFGYQMPALGSALDFNALALRVPEVAKAWFNEYRFVPVGDLAPADAGLSPDSMTSKLTEVNWDSAGPVGLRMKQWIVAIYNQRAPGQKANCNGYDVIRATWPGTLVILENERDGYNPHALGISHVTESLLASDPFLRSLPDSFWDSSKCTFN